MLTLQTIVTVKKIYRQHITETQTVTTCLIHIGRAYTAQRRADFRLTLSSLACSIQLAVGRQNKVRLLRDKEFALYIYTLRRDACQLLSQTNGVYNHAVTDYINRALAEDTRRHCTQHKTCIAKMQRVTSIRTTLKASNHLIIWGKHVYDLAFTFITPLQSKNYIYFFHLSNMVLSFSFNAKHLILPSKILFFFEPSTI